MTMLEEFFLVGATRGFKTTWTDAELLMYLEVTQCVVAYYCKSEVRQLVMMELRSLEHMANAREWTCEDLGNGFVKWKPTHKR
jgi:hypothetical protein